jgi:hypothetical protein
MVATTTDSSEVVIDHTAPALVSVSMTSDNTATPRQANGGDTLIVTIVANEAITSLSVLIASQPASVSGSGSRWTASYVVYGPAVSEGECSVSVEFEDLAGNVGLTARAATDMSTVMIDKTPPKLTTVAIASNNEADATKANAGDTIVLTIASSEAVVITDGDVRILGEFAAVLGSGTSWTASYFVTEDAVATGLAWISISYRDMASNEGATVSTVSDLSTVTVDLAAPTLPRVTIESDNQMDRTRANAGDTITLTITSSEAIVLPTVLIQGQEAVASGSGTSFQAVYTVGGVTDVDDGLVWILVEYEDLASNSGEVLHAVTDSSAVTVDTMPPTVLSLVMTSDNAADQTVASAADSVLVVVRFDEVILAPHVYIGGQAAQVVGGGGQWQARYTVLSDEISEGHVSVRVVFVDPASNRGQDAVMVTRGSPVTIDLTPPTLIAASIASNNTGDTSLAIMSDQITLQMGMDEAITPPNVTIGGEQASVSFTGGRWLAHSLTSSSLATEGEVAFSIVYSDLAGNQGETVRSTTDGTVVVMDLRRPVLGSNR